MSYEDMSNEEQAAYMKAYRSKSIQMSLPLGLNQLRASVKSIHGRSWNNYYRDHIIKGMKEDLGEDTIQKLLSDDPVIISETIDKIKSQIEVTKS